MAHESTHCDLSAREKELLHPKNHIYDSQAKLEKLTVDVTIEELSQDGRIGSTDLDINTVFWDSPQDPDNPYNWPQWRKTVNCTIISALSFVTPLGVSMLAPTIPEIMKSFRSSDNVVAAFVVSVYILGFASGPLLMAPLSEIYGRLPVYHICNTLFVVFLVACALAPSLEGLIALRFISGTFGSCILTNGGGSIADMIPQETRGTFMAAFSMGPLLGPAIGPIIGGFLANSMGWRWIFWLLAIISGILTALMMIFMKESYAPVILQRKVNRLRKETGNVLLRSKLDAGLSPRQYFKRNIIRPFKLLIFSPTVLGFAFYMTINAGYTTLMFTTIPEIFQGYYSFTSGTVGLAYLGLGLGSLAGAIYLMTISDRLLKKKASTDGQGMKPEYRLMPMRTGSILLPVGLFIYGWTAQCHMHYMFPIAATVLCGIGFILLFMTVIMYLIDSFTIYAASALAANTLVRSIGNALLPLAGMPMYDVLGMGWGNSLLAFVSVALIPVPFLMLKWGETLRKKFEIKDL